MLNNSSYNRDNDTVLNPNVGEENMLQTGVVKTMESLQEVCLPHKKKPGFRDKTQHAEQLFIPNLNRTKLHHTGIQPINNWDQEIVPQQPEQNSLVLQCLNRQYMKLVPQQINM